MELEEIIIGINNKIDLLKEIEKRRREEIEALFDEMKEKAGKRIQEKYFGDQVKVPIDSPKDGLKKLILRKLKKASDEERLVAAMYFDDKGILRCRGCYSAFGYFKVPLQSCSKCEEARFTLYELGLDKYVEVLPSYYQNRGEREYHIPKETMMKAVFKVMEKVDKEKVGRAAEIQKTLEEIPRKITSLKEKLQVYSELEKAGIKSYETYKRIKKKMPGFLEKIPPDAVFVKAYPTYKTGVIITMSKEETHPKVIVWRDGKSSGCYLEKGIPYDSRYSLRAKIIKATPKEVKITVVGLGGEEVEETFHPR